MPCTHYQDVTCNDVCGIDAADPALTDHRSLGARGLPQFPQAPASPHLLAHVEGNAQRQHDRSQDRIKGLAQQSLHDREAYHAQVEDGQGIGLHDLALGMKGVEVNRIVLAIKPAGGSLFLRQSL